MNEYDDILAGERTPVDLSIDDLLQCLCIRGGVNPTELVSPEDFPGPDYHDEGIAFWKRATVRPWIEARALAQLACMPGELQNLAKKVQVVREIGGEAPMSDEEAQELALWRWLAAKVRACMGL